VPHSRGTAQAPGLRIILLLLAAILWLGRAAIAQQSIGIGTEMDNYVRLLELEGKVSGTPLVYRFASLRPRNGGLTADSTHLWSSRYLLRPVSALPGGIVLTPLAGDARVFFNSAFPRSANDGVLWAGRGVSADVSGGAQISWGPFTGRLYPTLSYAQNQSFELAPVADSNRSPFAYPWRANIDWPQR